MQSREVRKQDFRTRNILDNAEKNFNMLRHQFLEKEQRFNDLEVKLNEFINACSMECSATSRRY